MKRFSLSRAEITGLLGDQDLDNFRLKQNFSVCFCHSVDVNASHLHYFMRRLQVLRDVCYTTC